MNDRDGERRFISLRRGLRRGRQTRPEGDDGGGRSMNNREAGVVLRELARTIRSIIRRRKRGY